MNDEKLLEALLKATRDTAELKHFQERHVSEFDTLREKVEESNRKLATLEASLKGLGDMLESERKLNRDRQLDASKLLDDKVGTIYKMVSVITTVISLVISLIHNAFK